MAEYWLPPRVLAGTGALETAGTVLASLGGRILILCGSRSLERRGILGRLTSSLRAEGLSISVEAVHAEPDVSLIDGLASAYRGRIDALMGLGGGSALDTAKALAALLPAEGSCADYLEGHGNKAHDGRRLPWAACPSTAGTGSEATFNAVIKGRDPAGRLFKRSLRHPNFLPDITILDPLCLLECPRETALACALDALSQLLEAATSARACPLSDAFVFHGLSLIGRRLEALLRAELDEAAWLDLQHAAMFSGVGIAHAGLGLSHGIAGRLGALRDAPHGAICGSLLPGAFALTLDALDAGRVKKDTNAAEGLARMAEACRRLFPGIYGSMAEDRDFAGRLVEGLESLVTRAGLPSLASWGFSAADLDEAAAGASGRDSIADLGADDARALLQGLA